MFRKRTTTERLWEILPGMQFWLVFFGAIFLSAYTPMWAALFIICFDLYWVLKAVNVALHLIASYRKFQIFVKIDWLDFTEQLHDFRSLSDQFKQKISETKKTLERNYYTEQMARLDSWIKRGVTGKRYEDYYHVVFFPFVDESFEVLNTTLAALSAVRYPKEKIMVVLASEERAGEDAQKVAAQVKERYGAEFFKFFVTVHPDGMPNEIKGKSANVSYAVESLLPEFEKLNIAVDDIIISNFDSDTVVHPQYFARVMYEFLLVEKPYQSSYQPIILYNNNIWDSPAFIRVVSVSNSFWQFTEGSRPDRLRTFSSHSMTLRALLDVGLYKRDIVNEDGYIYWQLYLHYKGDYQVVPLLIPASGDTCLAETTWQTLKNQYLQKRRWAYNVEYYPHLVPALLKSKAPFWDRMYKLFQYVEGNFNWATASILISLLGWLPLFLGGPAFTESVTAYNLPRITRTLMTTATFFLVFSVYINLILLPPRPKKYGISRSVMMYLQWVLVPFVSVVFGSLPAVEAQTRLMLGRYLEFFVTPKARKGESTGLSMKEMQTTKR